MGRSWADLGLILGPPEGQNRALALGGARFLKNRPFRRKVVSRRLLGRSWVDLGGQKGSSWEAFCDLSWVKKGKAMRCEKRPRLASSWGGGGPLLPLGHFGPAVIRGRLRGISPLVFWPWRCRVRCLMVCVSLWSSVHQPQAHNRCSISQQQS